jgi:isoleucyl-tRNA synthetase
MEYHELVLEELNVKELIDGELMLDTDMSPILQREGVMRELLRQIQSLRKNNGLEPHDVVALEVQTDKEGSDLITFFNDEICSTAGLSEIVRVENDGETIEIDSMMFVVRVRK